MAFTAMAAFFTTSSLAAGEVYGADWTSRGRFDLADSHAAWLEGLPMMIFPDDGVLLIRGGKPGWEDGRRQNLER
jgi:hypothetical protein